MMQIDLFVVASRAWLNNEEDLETLREWHSLLDGGESEFEVGLLDVNLCLGFPIQNLVIENATSI